MFCRIPLFVESLLADPAFIKCDLPRHSWPCASCIRSVWQEKKTSTSRTHHTVIKHIFLQPCTKQLYISKSISSTSHMHNLFLHSQPCASHFHVFFRALPQAACTTEFQNTSSTSHTISELCSMSHHLHYKPSC